MFSAFVVFSFPLFLVGFYLSLAAMSADGLLGSLVVPVAPVVMRLFDTFGASRISLCVGLFLLAYFVGAFLSLVRSFRR